MIKYNLKCKNKHEFEGWFSDSKEFEKLKSKKIIECTFCGTKNIQKTYLPVLINIIIRNRTTELDLLLEVPLEGAGIIHTLAKTLCLLGTPICKH